MVAASEAPLGATMWTICPESLPGNAATESNPQVQRPDHYATEPLNFADFFVRFHHTDS